MMLTWILYESPCGGSYRTASRLSYYRQGEQTKLKQKRRNRMKLSIRRWLALAVVPAALAMFGAVAPAHAVTFANCNDIPSTGHVGSVTVTQAGDCDIPFDLNYPDGTTLLITNGKLTTKKITSDNGEIFLSSTNSTVETKKLSAGTKVRVIAGLQGGTAASSITIDGDVISNASNIETGNANIMLRARGLIKTKDIKTNGTMGPASLRSGGVQIDADMSGQNNVLFTIGADTVNGVNGNINTRSVHGGGNTPIGTVESGIRITNGTANSTGGITVTDPKNIKLGNSNSRAGQVELNAQKGAITLPAGQLDASGETGQGAGFIFLLADKIVTADGTKINARQNQAVSGTIHQVVIAARTIEFQGQNGLEVLADGDGASSTALANIFVVPQGGVTSSSTNSIDQLQWTRTFTDDFRSFPGEVNFQGAGSAPLTISANGNNNGVVITGYPVMFSGGDLTISSRGENFDHDVEISFLNESMYDGTKGVAFNNSGDVLINVRPRNDMDGVGGDIIVKTDVIDFNTPSKTISLKAQGPTGQHTGNGGTIKITATQANLDDTTIVKLLADAAPLGTGSAVLGDFSDPNSPHAISFTLTGTSNFDFGGDDEQFFMSATGGKLSGNAGSVKVNLVNGSAFLPNVENFINASASETGATGNGGAIQIKGLAVTFPGTATPNMSLNAKGTTIAGEGGKIEILGSASTAPSNLPINVNEIMKVDGGNNLLNASEIDFGKITVNGVLCQQRTTGESSWPKSYWNCAHPLGSTQNEGFLRNAIVALPNNVQAVFENPDVQVYVMKDRTDFNRFFGSSGGPSFGSSVYDVAAAFNEDSQQNDISAFLPGIIMHELGHHYDLRTSPQPSQQVGAGTFGEAVDSVMSALVGNFPTIPQSPSCIDIFMDGTFCAPPPGHGEDDHPWRTLVDVYIGSQDINEEMFAFAFQTCSGHFGPTQPLNNAERTPEMRPTYLWIQSNVWGGSCPWQPLP